MNSKKISFLAKMCLLAATIIWGTTFFIMEGTIQNIGIFTLLGIRFTLAAIILTLVLFKRLPKIDKKYLFQGFLMGLFVIAAYIFQTFGLADEQTTPGKNAFLTATYCVIVPFLAWAVTKQKPDSYNIVAAVLCVLGITLISVNGGDFKSVCKGDILTLLGGVFFSFHMVAVAAFSKNRDVLLLTMLQFLFAGIFAWCFAFKFETFPERLPISSVGAILYLTVMATCLCYILQNVGQKYTSPSTAALILSLEAVFGVMFSVIFTSEQVTPKVFCGFAVVFLSIIISEVKPKFIRERK